MSIINLGRVGFVNKGDYVGGVTNHKINDIVKHNGSIYACIQAHNIEHLPTETLYWELWVGDFIVGTITALRGTAYIGQEIQKVTGYYTALDNIGVREYVWDATSTETYNGGTIIQVTGVVTGRWKMKYDGAVNVKWFGAKGDGIVDDTSAIQMTLDNFNNIYFPSGNYLSNNLSMQNKQYHLFGDKDSLSVITAISGISDTDYLIAPSAFINNSSFGSERILVERLMFNGNNLVKYPFILYSFFSKLIDCIFSGSSTGGYSLYTTDKTKNGTVCSTSLVENQIFKCRIYAGTGGAFNIENGQKISDGSLKDCFIYDGASSLRTLAGWNISGNHFYSGTVTFEKNSIGTLIQGNYFENGVTLADFLEPTFQLDNNTFNDDVTVSFGNSGRTAILTNNMFKGGANVIHNYFGSDRKVIVNGGSYENATLTVWHNDASTGIITLNRVYDQTNNILKTGTGNAVSNGYLEDVLLTQEITTWTTSSGSGPTTNYTWVNRAGRYIKEGKKITVFFYHEWTSASVGTGDSIIGILPFVSANITLIEYSGIVSNISSTSAVDQFTLFIEPNSSNLKARVKVNGSASTIMQKTAWSTGTNYIAGSITYFIN